MSEGRPESEATEPSLPDSGTCPGAVSARERHAITAIILAALGLRFAHLTQILRNDPFFYLPSVDPRIYHDWAVSLSRGDWLGSEIFSLGPLYPYLLGALYWLAGPNILLAKGVNVLLGGLCCGLIWQLGRQLFSPRVGLLGAALWAVYAMAIFYEGTLMITNVQTPLVLGLLLACEAARRRPGPARFAIVGVLLGLGALSRPNLLLFGAVVVPWLLLASAASAPRGRRLLLTGAFLAGLGLCIAPVTLRNYAVSGEFVLIVAGGGAQFYTGNNPEADGTYRIPSRFPKFEADTPWKERAIYRAEAEAALGRPMQVSEVSPYWVGQGLGWIAANPLQWLALEARKLALFFNAAELWNNRTITVARDFSWVLRLPLVSFGLVMPFAAVGLWVSRRRFAALVFPLGVVGVFLASALLFFVISRFRMPAVPVLILFASVGVFALIERARARAWPALAGLLALLTASVAFVHLPLVKEDLGMAHFNLANRYLMRGQGDRAVEHYWHSLRWAPGYFPAYENLALAYETSGDPARARAAWQGVLDVAQQSGDRLRAERAAGHVARLDAEYGDALRSAPRTAPALRPPPSAPGTSRLAE